jgi:hypothetical protein
VALNWARRLKRVFGIEIEQCARCGGRLEVIASIEELELIERILAGRRLLSTVSRTGGGNRQTPMRLGGGIQPRDRVRRRFEIGCAKWRNAFNTISRACSQNYAASICDFSSSAFALA